jgi:hypothetical protein
MVKSRYAIDEFNRLLVSKGTRQYALAGEFKIEKSDLIFEPDRKSPLLKELGLSQRIKFLGDWQLTEDYNLKLSLTENDYQYKDDELEIKGRIISGEAQELVFEAQCKKTPLQDKFVLLRLGGRWQANEFNELNFLVSKYKDEDILRFRGTWSINQNQEITYVYEKPDRRRARRAQEFITLKGFWQINTKDKLVYILDLKNKSFLEFKVQLEEQNLRGEDAQIRYRLGMGVKELRQERVFSLFGKWNIRAKKNISFEIDYGKRGLRAIDFGASVFLNKNNEFVFELKDRREKDLGFSITFNRRFMKRRAALFARLSKLENDLCLEAGVKIPW